MRGVVGAMVLLGFLVLGGALLVLSRGGTTDRSASSTSDPRPGRVGYSTLSHGGPDLPAPSRVPQAAGVVESQQDPASRPTQRPSGR